MGTDEAMSPRSKFKLCAEDGTKMFLDSQTKFWIGRLGADRPCLLHCRMPGHGDRLGLFPKLLIVLSVRRSNLILCY
jgi:hypothetical protein